MAPVSICMLLVVLLVYSLSSSSAAAVPICTATNLVYLETPSDSVTQKLEGALLNSLVSSTPSSSSPSSLSSSSSFTTTISSISSRTILASPPSSSLPQWAAQSSSLSSNISQSQSIPSLVSSCFSISLLWVFSLCSLVLGLLKILVELVSSRDEELPTLVYEAWPTVVGGFSDSGSVEFQYRSTLLGPSNPGNI
ncbi:hypothetical protein ACSBR1_007114 [Camellia fascicularis]